MLIDVNENYINVFVRKFVVCCCIFYILCIAIYNCTYKMKHIIRIVSNKTTGFY